MQGIEKFTVVSSSCHYNLKFANFMFLLYRGLHVQHAFFSFTPAIKFLIRDVFVVFPLSMLKLAEIRLMTSWSIYLRYLINKKSKTMRQILPQLFLLLSSHPSSVQLILERLRSGTITDTNTSTFHSRSRFRRA